MIQKLSVSDYEIILYFSLYNMAVFMICVLLITVTSVKLTKNFKNQRRGGGAISVSIDTPN